MQEVSLDKVFELEFSGVAYLLHINAESQGMHLDLEDKATGDVWTAQYSAEKIEENTQKTGSFKKYPIFIKMLLEAIAGSCAEVELDLLTYHDLELLKSRKGYAKNMSSVNNNKRYLMLNYVAAFDKVHYPIQLNFEEVPSADRLKLTVRRLRGQLDIYRRDRPIGQQDLIRDITYFKQQNQLLKSRIKKLEDGNMSMLQQSQVKSMHRDDKLQNDYNFLKQLLSQAEQQVKLYKARYEESEKENKELKGELSIVLKEMEGLQQHYEKQMSGYINKKTYQELNNKVNDLTKQTGDLISQLNFSREQEKKSKIRIGQLEKELESVLKRRQAQNSLHSITTTGNKRPGTPKSQKKGQQTKRNSVRKKSVIDSDTESSRMRKQSNRMVSPFRNSKAVGNSPARSKSKQRITTHKPKSKKSISPRSNVMTESEQNIDPNYASDSDSDTSKNKVARTMAQLRRQREQGLKLKEKEMPKNDSGVKSVIQNKIQHIAELLRKSRKE